MSAEGSEDKIIVKNENYQGVVLSDRDFTLLSSVPASWSVVTKSMWKVKGITYIGVKQFANEPGDIIRLGRLGKHYRIISFVKREGTRRGKGGDIIRIKRADGNLTTNVDLENGLRGTKVKILNRRNFIDLLDHPWGRDYVEPCKVLPTRVIPCEDSEEGCDC